MFISKQRTAIKLLGAGLLGIALHTTATAYVQENPKPSEIFPNAVNDRTLDVANVNDKFLISVGDRGHIFKSQDGHKWEQIQAPVRAMLNAVEFADENNGWAVGHDATILKTTDGGSTWQIQEWEAIWGRPRSYFDILVFNKNNSIAVGTYGMMKRTQDGGTSWQDIESPLAELEYGFNGITELKDGTLVVVGERTIMGRSTDGGKTWEMLTSPYGGSWFGVKPFGEKGAIFYGLRGNIYIANDVSILPTEDPEEWDEFEVETITNLDTLTSMGWRKAQTNSTKSYFGGTSLPNGGTVVVGLNGEIWEILPSGKLMNIPNPQGITLNSATPWKGGLVGVGKAGAIVLK